MLKKFYYLFSLVIICLFFQLKTVSANEDEFPPSEETHQTNTSQENPVDEDTVLPAPPADAPQTLAFTQSSSSVFHDAGGLVDGVDLHSDSMMVNAVPIKVQKCCSPRQVLNMGQYSSECVDTEEDFVIDVFWANRTHYWNYTKSTAGNVTVVTRNPCTQSKYFLDPMQDENDTFRLLHNSSLYIPYSMDMLSENDYCVDTIMTSSSTLLTTAIICTATPKTDIFHYLFGAGEVISVISLVLLAVYSMLRIDISDDHKKCLAFFSGTMASSFFFLAISTFFGIKFYKTVNILIAYTVYYLKLKYFIWLTVLCYDTFRFVKVSTENSSDRKSYIKRYMLAAFSIPVVFILINLIDRCNPALPNLYLEFSYSSSFLWGLFLFYVPTIITVCIDVYIMSSIVLPKGKCKNLNELINYMRSEKWTPTPAPENIAELRNVYRRTYILCFLILFFLLLDLIIYLLPSSGEQKVQFMFRNVIFCLQGLFVSCIFVRKDCCSQQTPTETLNTTETEMRLLTRNGGNGNV